MASCGVEEARKIVERARKHVAVAALENYSAERKGEGLEDDDKGEGRREGEVMATAAAAEGIRALIRATWEDVKEWCDEEAEARVRRKDSQVISLISTRHYFFSNGWMDG